MNQVVVPLKEATSWMVYKGHFSFPASLAPIAREVVFPFVSPWRMKINCIPVASVEPIATTHFPLTSIG